MKDNERKLFINLERTTLKLEEISHISCSIKHVMIITYCQTIQECRNINKNSKSSKLSQASVIFLEVYFEFYNSNRRHSFNLKKINSKPKTHRQILFPQN